MLAGTTRGGWAEGGQVAESGARAMFEIFAALELPAEVRFWV